MITSESEPGACPVDEPSKFHFGLLYEWLMNHYLVLTVKFFSQFRSFVSVFFEGESTGFTPQILTRSSDPSEIDLIYDFDSSIDLKLTCIRP